MWFCLLLVVLLVMSAFAVDLGSWYSRASELQKAADAAALAGVARMPDVTRAHDTAEATAKRNGFVDGQNGIQITYTPLPPRRYRVDILDTKVQRYFSQVVAKDPMTITRPATAEYALPVPLGSPENYFGTGSIDLGGGYTSNIWASVNGFCASQEDGDRYLSRYDGIRTGYSGATTCPYPGSQYPFSLSSPRVYNSEYDPRGYYYDIEVPDSRPDALQIELFDPTYDSDGSCPSVPHITPDSSLGGSTITTTFRLWYAPQPLDHGSDQLLEETTYLANDGGTCGKWNSFYSIPTSASPGLYRIQVFTKANEANSAGSNQFAIRAGYGGTWTRCNNIAGDARYSASCPAVHGENAISVYANKAASTAEFYLAKVDAVYRGKGMNIQLFDPGEGARSIEILDPNGDPVQFDYATGDDNTGNPDSASNKGFLSYSGSAVTSLDVSGTITPPSGFASNYKFSDRHLVLKTTIPNDYTASNGGWYKIRYKTSSDKVTDRTTWSVTILDNPIHLVPDN